MPTASAPPDPWYASGTFWAIIGVAVAVIFGIGAIVAAYGSQNPRRRLNVFVSSSTPLVHEKGQQLALEVMSNGDLLENPHLVTVEIVVRGRRDIRKDAFDGPIELMFGARIVGVLEASATSKVPGTPEPVWNHTGDDVLLIEPALLRRDHKLAYTVLVDGPHPPDFQAIVPIEVDVRMESPVPPDPRIRRNLVLIGILFTLGSTLSVLQKVVPIPGPDFGLVFVGAAATHTGFAFGSRPSRRG